MTTAVESVEAVLGLIPAKRPLNDSLISNSRRAGIKSHQTRRATGELAIKRIRRQRLITGGGPWANKRGAPVVAHVLLIRRGNAPEAS